MKNWIDFLSGLVLGMALVIGMNLIFGNDNSGARIEINLPKSVVESLGDPESDILPIYSSPFEKHFLFCHSLVIPVPGELIPVEHCGE